MFGRWGYRCTGPSATPARTTALFDAGGRASAVNSPDEAQKASFTEYPRRNGDQRESGVVFESGVVAVG